MPDKQPALEAFEDPDHEGNSAKYRTGKRCWFDGCDRPAGTAWAPLFCFECNVKRMKKISRQMEEIADNWPERAPK